MCLLHPYTIAHILEGHLSKISQDILESGLKENGLRTLVESCIVQSCCEDKLNNSRPSLYKSVLQKHVGMSFIMFRAFTSYENRNSLKPMLSKCGPIDFDCRSQ